MTDPSCLELMQAAMTRKTKDGRCVGPGERMTAEAALRAVTIDAAYQIRKEDVLGSITPGKYADLAVLTRNPLLEPHDSIADIKVTETWLGGQRVWSHAG